MKLPQDQSVTGFVRVMLLLVIHPAYDVIACDVIKGEVDKAKGS